MSTLTALEVVRMVNTGTLLWETVGALVEQALANGVEITMEDVDASEIAAGSNLDALRDAIEAKKLRDGG